MVLAASVFRASFDSALPHLAGLHTPAQDAAFYRHHVFACSILHGASVAGAVVGFVAVRDVWIDQFYVLPAYQRQGIGRALLEVAKSTAPELSLWTFQCNHPARRFYERHGWTADGTDANVAVAGEPVDTRYERVIR